MTTYDYNSITLTAQPVEVQYWTGSAWSTVTAAQVQRIVHNAGAACNEAHIYFPALRWHEAYGITWGTRIRCVTQSDPKRGDDSLYPDTNITCLFDGFATNYHTKFSPTNETNQLRCLDWRWRLSRTGIYGQWARARTDAVADCTHFTGRRTIFNAAGRGNKDPDDFQAGAYTMGLFAPVQYADSWTLADMLWYVLCPKNNPLAAELNITDSSSIPALAHADLTGLTPGSVLIDTLDITAAVSRLLSLAGWSWQEKYTAASGPSWVFFKPGETTADTRSTSDPIILHSLHAPAVGENIHTAVGEGKKILSGAILNEDIRAVVNTPIGLGSPHIFECTFDLVPAWQDADLVYDTNKLFYTESELQELTDKDSISFHKYFHPGGSDFRRDVGRKWALNETGAYSHRGNAFDFASVIDAAWVLDGAAELWGPFARRFGPCITLQADSIASVGIRASYSIDGGTTWHLFEGAVENMKDEAAIRIADPNLSEILVNADTFFTGDVPFSGQQLNYWTSLCRDKLSGNPWTNWLTRVHVTATIQMDQRITSTPAVTVNSGSPFDCNKVYDLSDQYKLQQRMPSSGYAGGGLSALDLNHQTRLDDHTLRIQDANEDLAIAAQFTLNRCWYGDGSGQATFLPGDSISEITGRDYPINAAAGGGNKYPEIVQVIYHPQNAKMDLVTRRGKY